MIREDVKLEGRVRLWLIGPDGKLKDYRDQKNLLVTNGKNVVVARLGGTTIPAIQYLGIGTGTVAPTIGDTDLGTPLLRQVFDIAGGTIAGNSNTFFTTIAAGTGTGTIGEAGLFTASSGNYLFARIVFVPTVVKSSVDSLVISWTVTAP